MSIGDIAGLIAAVAFVGLVGFLAVPLVKLGGVLEEARESVRKMTDHATPILDETVNTVTEANGQLAKIDSITSSVAEISANASALTSLIAATIGGPLIKVAAFTYGVRQAVSGLFNREPSR